MHHAQCEGHWGLSVVNKTDMVLALTELLIWWRERDSYQIFINKYKIAAMTNML